MRIFCSAKDSHIFPTKNNSVQSSSVTLRGPLHCAHTRLQTQPDFRPHFSPILHQKVLTIILVHSQGSCLSSETNHARNSAQNVIFVFSKYYLMSFLCHHTENFCLRHFVLEVCRTIAICVDRNRTFAN